MAIFHPTFYNLIYVPALAPSVCDWVPSVAVDRDVSSTVSDDSERAAGELGSVKVPVDGGGVFGVMESSFA